MKIDLTKIYAGLEAWRDERRITAESQKDGYIVNVMEEFGELAAALRDYEKYTNFLAGTTSPFGDGRHYDIKKAEHAIIDALCDIGVLTINAAAHIPCEIKPLFIELKSEKTYLDASLSADYILKQLVEKCAEFSYFEWEEARRFKIILANCAYLCQHYGYNFELSMLETIKELNSRTGAYDEASKKWIKDTSPEARAKWHTANYELARIKDE